MAKDEHLDTGDQCENGTDNSQDAYIDLLEKYTDVQVQKEENSGSNMTKFDTIKNLITVSVSFTMLNSAFLSFSNLQSSVHSHGGLGTIGLSLIYSSAIVTSLFLAPLILAKFTLKRIMVVSMVMHITYLLTGFYPSWSTIVPTSVLIGSGVINLWTAQQAYLTELAKRYATVTKNPTEGSISFFFGIFYGIYFTTQIWGNLVSSVIFHRSNQESNSSLVEDRLICGASYCPADLNHSSSLELPSQHKLYAFSGACVAIGCVSVIALSICLQPVAVNYRPRVGVTHLVKSVCVHLLTSRKQKLLIVTTILRGMSQAFIAGDITLAFVSCPFGVGHVGFVMIVYGISGAVCALLFGKLSKYTGHFFLFVIALFAHLSTLLLMLLWKPYRHQIAVVYGIVCVWGVADAVLLPSVPAIYSLYFKEDRDVAVGTFRLLDSLGYALTFGYSSVLCTRYKIYIVLGFSFTSSINLIVFYVTNRKKTKK